MLPAPSHSTVASIAAMSMAGAVVSSIVNVAVVLLLLPQSSVAVKVTVAIPVAPQSSLKEAKSLLQDTSLHASEALAPPLPLSHVSRSAAFPAPSHSAVASTAAMSMDGAVVSSIVNVAVVLLLLPQSSVAVKVTVAIPVAPQSSLKEAKSLLQVTSLHASEALAPPLLASHASRSAALPTPSHSTVASIAAMSKVGAVVSSMVNVAVVLLLLPQSSVAVKVTVASPVAPQSSLKEAKSLLQVTSPQASEALAPPLLLSHASRSAALPAPSHSTERLEASTSMVGAVVSMTVMV